MKPLVIQTPAAHAKESPISNVPNILILEDDDNLRALLAEVLEEEGFNVTAVDRGEAAVELAGTVDFDLIVADIRMEGIGGLEAIEQAQRLQPGMGSMIVSGYATEAETAKAERLEVGAYLTKPFKIQELLQHVRNILADRGQGQKEQRDKDFHRILIDWSLTAAGQMVDDSGALEGSLLAAAATSEKLCNSLGYPPQVCLNARWATIMLGLARLPDLDIPEVCLQPNTHLPVLTKLINDYQNPELEEPTTDVQAVTLALALHLDHEEKPARVCQEVLDAQTRIGPTEETKERPPLEVQLGLGQRASRHRSLVNLARTLEKVGDLESAAKAYRSLSQEEVRTQERLEGIMGLARLASRAGARDVCETNCMNIIRMAKTHGPSTLTGVGLEAALLLEKMKSDHATQGLKAVKEAAQSMGLQVRSALVQCALTERGEGELTPADLDALTSPSSANELGRYVDWLLPHLIDAVQAEASPLAPVLVQVICDFPRRFHYCFEPARCTTAKRLKVGQLLSESRHLPESVLEGLDSDPEAPLREVANLIRSRQQGRSVVQIVRVHSFGQLELLSQGETVSEKVWKTRKIKFLFALLAARWGKPVTEDLIMEVFWPKDQTRSKNNLYWATTALRGVLKALSPQSPQPLIREHGTLSLDPEFPRWHDFEEFEKATAEAKKLDAAKNAEGALSQFRLAARLHRGPFMEGCYYDFALTNRDQTDRDLFDILTRAAELCLDVGEDGEALEHSSRAVDLMNFRQEAHALKMRSHIRLGQATQAISQYQKLESMLKQEYDMEPNLDLFELYQRARLGFPDA